MKNNWLFIFPIFPIFTVVLISCSENKPGQSYVGDSYSTHEDSLTASTSYRKGEIVPNNEVCIVNDAFMGKQQIEVSYGGNIYYGCCQMCRTRIQRDESVRMAIDPVSKMPLEKSKAVIAITGDRGEVSYFESKMNYKVFFEIK